MVLMWKLEGKSQFKLPRRGCKDTVTSYLKEIVWVKVEQLYLVLVGNSWCVLLKILMKIYERCVLLGYYVA